MSPEHHRSTNTKHVFLIGRELYLLYIKTKPQASCHYLPCLCAQKSISLRDGRQLLNTHDAFPSSFQGDLILSNVSLEVPAQVHTFFIIIILFTIIEGLIKYVLVSAAIVHPVSWTLDILTTNHEAPAHNRPNRSA